MDQKIKEKWVEALRSGKYKQCQTRLRIDNSFCCLGVLCDISGMGKWKARPDVEAGLESYDVEGDEYLSLPPVDMMNEFGLDSDNLSDLTKMNDMNGDDFNTIADWIEKNL